MCWKNHRVRGELDAKEAREFFRKIGMKLALTTAYNPEANDKNERGHSPIVKALVEACNARCLIGLDCYHLHCGLFGLLIVRLHDTCRRN